MMKYVRIKGTLKTISQYECEKCHSTAAGTQRRHEFDGLSPEDLKTYLETAPLRAQNMPYGWGHYEGGFRCEDCVRSAAA